MGFKKEFLDQTQQSQTRERREKQKKGLYHLGPSLEKSKWSCFFLAMLFGLFGLHRFYVGRKTSGIIYSCTLGLLGIGVIVDEIMILWDMFTDVNNHKLENK